MGGYDNEVTMSVPTDQQIVDALRQAYYNLAVGGVQSYSTMGRTFTKFDINMLLEQIKAFEWRIIQASQPGLGTILVRTGQPN